MNDSLLALAIRERGAIPLSWAGSTLQMDYLNLGDALSPVIAALMSGMPIERVPMRSRKPRLAAVGTIGQGFSGGHVSFWGTGSSARAASKHSAREGCQFEIAATRGPLSRAFLGGQPSSTAIYGDPVWLLPRFYRPKIEKRWKIGVIPHLSELGDRHLDAKPHAKRYEIGGGDSSDVRVINTLTAISPTALRDKIDEILSCERIVSNSLHGMVIAESYGIPCLHLASGRQIGMRNLPLTIDCKINSRIIDLYLGLGETNLDVYVQHRHQATDWQALAEAIDRHWYRKSCDEERLIQAFPIDGQSIRPPADGTVWDHPAITSIQFRHDVAKLRRDSSTGLAKEKTSKLSAVQAAVEKITRALRPIALSWVATTKEHPHANLGDALSPLIVATMSGRPIKRARFYSSGERLVAVGTIGHAQRNGRLLIWGTGFDAKRHPTLPDTDYARPPDTAFNVSATRGPFSADLLRANGVGAPEVYGDPVWLLPRIWPGSSRKTHELGVILHISELAYARLDASARQDFLRYRVPPRFAGSIRIINTYCRPGVDALRGKIDEITSCRRILSTSLHGLVIGEAYGIPSAWFAPRAGEPARLPIHDASISIDHRMRDFYAGAGASSVLSFCQSRSHESDWNAAMRFLDKEWQPLDYDPRPLIEAFPHKLAVDPDRADWQPPSFARSIRY